MTTGELQKKTRLRHQAGEVKQDKEPPPRIVAKEEREERPQLGERYEVLSVIGKGGMGTVYKVFDRETEKILAIKVLQSDLAGDQTALRRFEQEAAAAAQLEHNNLVSVFGYGKTESAAPYLVMDYLEGESLSSILRDEGCLEPARSLNIFQQICEALLHAHEKGVIHRDIKPANVIVSKTDSGVETARVVDFGIAKILPVSNRETHNLTETRQVFGSPHYMSPEHCLGFKMDERSDIYSLGCLMYEILTGNPPFPESDAIQVVIKHINDEAKAFSGDLSDDPVRKKMESVVLKCLEKEQSDRYQTVGEVLKDLELIQAGKAPSRFVRRKAGKLEYTASQIARAIFGTILSLLFLGCSLGWLALEGNQLLGGAMFLICLAGAYLFGATVVEQLRRIAGGKNACAAWWNMAVVISLTAMCLTYAPCAFEAAVSSFQLQMFSTRPGWLIDLYSGLSIAHLLSIGSVLVSLAGRLLFGSARKTKIYRIGFQYACIAYSLALLAMTAFPNQVSTFTKHLSQSEILERHFPASSEGLLNFALKLNPLNQSALFSLVDKNLENKKPEKVDQLFNDYFAMETAPKQLAAAHFKKAESLEDQSWRRLSEMSKAIKYYPRYDYYEARAQLHMDRGEFGDAMKDFEEAIRSNPNSPVPHIGRAKIFAATNNFQIALAQLDGVAAQKSGWANMDVFFLRALLCDHLNRHGLAVRDFMNVAEIAKTKYSLSAEDAYKAAYSFKMIGDQDNYILYLNLAQGEQLSQSKFNAEYRELHLPLDWKKP